MFQIAPFAALTTLKSTASAEAQGAAGVDLTAHPLGWLVVTIFMAAYALVVFEERTGLRKSKPVMLAAALIWSSIAAYAALTPELGTEFAGRAFEAIFLEFAELFFFLVVAMSFVSAMSERGVFEAMRAELTSRGFTFRQLFWLTGGIAFFLSALIDNLTTALVMASVILAVGRGNSRFIALAFINLVVAANAGGAWCAFGDITTLMAWQAGRAEFADFFHLFLPATINFLIPAFCMQFAIPNGRPTPQPDDADVKTGGYGICALFALTIAITVIGKQLLGMPTVFGMMTGLALLKTYAYFIGRTERRRENGAGNFNIFRIIATAEWDTLLFFYGVLLCVGGLAALGYLELTSHGLYGGSGFTWGNIALGSLSAIVDNIPIMYAVLVMNPPMDLGQWLLITLTTGVGGSLLSVGSAAGVALMGQARGHYTFLSHLRWTWAIALGYAASIAMHLWWNAGLFGATGG